MWNCQSKYVCIFLLLALSGLFFLFRNINILEWKLNSTLDLSSIHSEGSPPCLDRKLSFFCSHLVQEPSTQEALEDCSLLESIAGPEPLPVTTPLNQTSDPAHSLFAILPAGGGRERHVGDQLEALVLMNDFQGRPKSRGGDFLLARLHTPELGAGVAGQVLDHLNGTYSAIFPLLWEGSVWVEVTLVHPSEAVSLLRRLQEERLNWVPSKSLFRSGLLSETTECNLCLPNNQQPLCDYTDPRSGEPWFCYKPKQLACDTRINHFKAGSQTYLQHLTSKEALFFQSGININVHIHATGSDSVTVLPKGNDKPDEESSSVAAAPIRTPPLPSWTPPSGYYYQGSWRALDGVLIRQFNDPAAVIQCLKGKQVYMYGDSSVRQYYDYLTSFVPELKKFNLRSHVRAGPFMAVNIPNNILLKYRCHGPPIFWPPLSVSQLHYVANELDGLAGGSDTVVVISVSTHFSFFPLQAYIRRLRRIRRAVVRLLNRAPGTVVVVRSANLDQRKDNFINSDWILTQLDRVLKVMFRGLDVMLLDAWEMTLAHHLPHDLHPAPPHHQEHDKHNPLWCLPPIIKNMINIE